LLQTQSQFSSYDSEYIWLNLKMMKRNSDVSTASSVKPGLSKSFSSRLRGGKKTSVLGELLRSSVPPWVQQLHDSGLSAEEEKKLKGQSSECALCHTSLKSARDMEPANKKVCHSCNAVICRQCAVHVHLLGHVRRRYVCWKCVGEAAVATKLVAPLIVVEKVEVNATAGKEPARLAPQESVSEADAAHEEGLLTSFVSRLWDSWNGFSGKDGAISEMEEDMSIDEEASTRTITGPKEKTTQELDQEKLEKMNALINGVDGNFDGESLRSLLEVAHCFKGDPTLVLALPFTKACTEVIKLMAGLGKAFEFAGSDMNDKLSIMGKRCAETAADAKVPTSEVTLQMMIEREIKMKTTHNGKKAAGATRTIVRLLWFLDFIGVLLMKLANEPKTALPTILSATYEETLGPRHVWVLRRIIRAGMGMVPEKKVFIAKLGLEGVPEAEQSEKMKSWAKTVDSVRADMWKYINAKGLGDVP